MTRSPRPPSVTHRVLALLLPPHDRECVLSELGEEWEVRYARGGQRKANAWYRRQAVWSVGSAIGQQWHGRMTARKERRGAVAMMATDVVHVWRRLRREPGLVLMIVLALGAATGVSVASFSIVDSFVDRQVPFDGGERIYRMNHWPASVTTELRRHPAFEWVEGTTGRYWQVQTPGGDVGLEGALVTPSLFGTLGVAPFGGRLFEPGEGLPGSMDRVLLSEALWRTQFDAAPDILGRYIQVDGTPVVVVGIMARDFQYPNRDTALWMPLDEREPVESPPLEVHFKLTAGVPLADAMAIIRQVTEAQAIEVDELGNRPHASLLKPPLDNRQQLAFKILLLGAGLIFTAVCASLGNLLLARLVARQRDLVTRVTLGASLGRLIRESILEHGSLGLAGVAVGVWLAHQLIEVTGSFMRPLTYRSLNPVDLDMHALLFAGLLGLTAVIAAGVMPAWIATRCCTRGSSQASHGSTGGPAARVVQRILLTTQVALACVLILGAAVLARSLFVMAAADRGLNVEGVTVANFAVPLRARSLDVDYRALALRTRERVEAMAGVQQVSLSVGVPPGATFTSEREYRSDMPDGSAMTLRVESYDIDSAFFDLYGIPILAGRAPNDDDPETDVVVSERLATLFWPERNPVGHSFRVGTKSYQVIGVAREITFPTLKRERDLPEFYRRYGSMDFFSLSLRCEGPCPSQEAVETQVAAEAPYLKVNRVVELENVYLEALNEPRVAAVLGLAFSAAALLTAALGLFSVFSHTIGRRRREFGIRVALGASPQVIRFSVLREALVIATSGTAVGAAGAWGLGQLLGSLEYGVTTADPISWLAVVGVMTVTTVSATWGPSSNATRADPAGLLRSE